MSYLDRLNKLILVVDKKLKTNSAYNDQLHASVYACVLESTRLAYHIYHDSSLDKTHKQTRYKMLNEWITRMLLTLDNITIPLIKPTPSKIDAQSTADVSSEAEELILDPEKRARRKSLINLCLAIGSELSLLSGNTSSSSSSQSYISSPPPPSSSSSKEGSLEHFMWESPASSSPVHPLLAIANPNPIASSH